MPKQIVIEFQIGLREGNRIYYNKDFRIKIKANFTPSHSQVVPKIFYNLKKDICMKMILAFKVKIL